MATSDFTGTNGAAWPSEWTVGQSTGSSSATIDTNRGKMTLSQAGGYTDRRTQRLNLVASTADIVTEGTFMVPNLTSEVFGQSWVRCSTDVATDGYFLSLSPFYGDIGLFKRVGGAQTQLGAAVAFTWAANTITNWKLEATGTTIRAKVWSSGGEPGSWTISRTDSSHSAGFIGLSLDGGASTSQPYVCYWDNFTYPSTISQASGTIPATSTVTGSVTAKMPTSGTVAGTSGLIGDAIVTPEIASGTVAGVSAVSGDATVKVGAAGTVAGTSGVTGAIAFVRYGVSGTVAGTSAASGAVTARLLASGTAAATSGLSGTIGSHLLVSGVVNGVSAVLGGLLVTGKPGQGNEVLVLFDENEVLTGGRVTYYQFDLLDAQENLLGTLRGVRDGDLSFDAYSAVKSTGKLTVVSDPTYAHVPDSQPDFLGVQVNTPTGPQAVATSTTGVPADRFITSDADASDISVGDRVIITDSASQPKSGKAYTVRLKNSVSGDTSIYLTPDALVDIDVGDLLKVVTVGFEQRVDWLNARIRPMISISRLGGGDDPAGRLVPAGVYLCAAPVEQWTDAGLMREVELADKLSILDQDIASGDPSGIAAYALDTGANIIDAIKALIAETGEESPAIEPDTKVLAAPMVWEVGTTRLRVINDLLDAAGYFSLWCDGYGHYQAKAYVQPSDRVPVYESIAPFSDGPRSLMDPGWTRDRDIYSIPNRVLLVGQGTGEVAALTSTATNVDPDSPYSFPSRGRWITLVEIGVEAASQTELDTLARARLSRATSITNQLTVRHAYLPDLLVNSVVKFVNPDSGLDTYCYVVNTTIPFDPTGLCQTVMRLVT